MTNLILCNFSDRPWTSSRNCTVRDDRSASNVSLNDDHADDDVNNELVSAIYADNVETARTAAQHVLLFTS